MEPTLEQFVANLESSQLLGSGPLDAIRSEIASGAHADANSLADALIARKVITNWQAEKLLGGVDNGFFLGKHRLLRLVASSTMSSVYEAEHLLLHRRVALKVLHKSLVGEGSYLERFYREARAVARLDHPNIIRGFDVGQEGDHHFIAMEFCQGSSLQDLFEAYGPFPLDDAVEMIRQAALGLESAHQAGLVHRDIKPANLLRDLEGTVKILDLGLVRYHPGGDSAEAALTRIHDEGVLGTVDYLSPEQALDSHNVDIRSDIYSLGCTLYFLVTGTPPFGKGGLAERLLAHQTQVPTPLTALRPDAPKSLSQIVGKMMAKRPEGRYQSPGEVAAALGDWLIARRDLRPGSNPEAESPTTFSKVIGRTKILQNDGQAESVATAPIEGPDSSRVTDRATSPTEGRIAPGWTADPEFAGGWGRWARVVESTGENSDEATYQAIYQDLIQSCRGVKEDADESTRTVLRQVEDLVGPWPTLRSLRSILMSEMGSEMLMRFHEIDQAIRSHRRHIVDRQVILVLVAVVAAVALIYSVFTPR